MEETVALRQELVKILVTCNSVIHLYIVVRATITIFCSEFFFQKSFANKRMDFAKKTQNTTEIG